MGADRNSEARDGRINSWSRDGGPGSLTSGIVRRTGLLEDGAEVGEAVGEVLGTCDGGGGTGKGEGDDEDTRGVVDRGER